MMHRKHLGIVVRQVYRERRKMYRGIRGNAHLGSTFKQFQHIRNDMHLRANISAHRSLFTAKIAGDGLDVVDRFAIHAAVATDVVAELFVARRVSSCLWG